jgi:hypothetical protein
LWTRYSDAELLDVMVRFQQSRSAEEAGRDLQLMLPALSIDELTRIYSGLRRSLPPAAWDASLALSRSALTSSEAQQLDSRLSASPE